MAANRDYAIWPGNSYPLGATWDGQGVNFALFSAHAEKVDLCIFDEYGRREVARLELPEYTDEVWHGYLPNAHPGLLYGYRVYGPYAPSEGHRFNHHKLLIDPYAKSLRGELQWRSQNFAFRPDSPRADLTFDRRDNARFIPKSVVVDTTHPWAAQRGPRMAWQDMIIYEAHVRGLTKSHPEIPPEEQGTFAGLGNEAVISYLKDLGITSLELLPVHPVVDEQHLVNAGLKNYWGYNSYNFFSIEPRLLATGMLNEFRAAIRHLHDAGIEVILDVVYNHTGEGNHIGPTFCFRGIDNKSYYELTPEDPRYYLNHTGCGNTVSLRHPRVLQMVMDSLRYWVEVMHVDGFRFDLATVLARNGEFFEPRGPFLSAVRQDPVLSKVRLIAEPWDVGPNGYQVGGFPPGWSEWNDRYRDTVRAFWKGTSGLIGEVATSLTGSSAYFGRLGRRPRSSINFVTAHDGFTMTDLVSYNHKHNEANLEENRDGTNNNNSWNCGVEGPTRDPKITALRYQQKRNLMATLMLSQGVPMMLGGDERGRSQNGNNNTYCQDNELNWFDWSPLEGEDAEFYEFTKMLIALRKKHPAFGRPRFFKGTHIGEDAIKDITWLSPEGRELTQEEWGLDYARCFGFHLGGDTGDYVGRTGNPMVDDRFITLLNGHFERIPFILPGAALGESWEVVFDTARPGFEDMTAVFGPFDSYQMQGRSLVLLRHVPARNREL
ncbi:MAG: glycogen debranching protein GlgX [Magnetospiraceae bacterium]